METGASNWLSPLPIKAKGFSLNKQEFTDALALRYGWKIEGLPDLCISCEDRPKLDEQHAMTYKRGGFICMRHDEFRDLTYKMLKEACRDVSEESLPGGSFQLKTANTDPVARVEICDCGLLDTRTESFLGCSYL